MTIFPLLAEGKRHEDERWILDLFHSFHVSIKLKTEAEKKVWSAEGPTAEQRVRAAPDVEPCFWSVPGFLELGHLQGWIIAKKKKRIKYGLKVINIGSIDADEKFKGCQNRHSFTFKQELCRLAFTCLNKPFYHIRLCRPQVEMQFHVSGAMMQMLLVEILNSKFCFQVRGKKKRFLSKDQ